MQKIWTYLAITMALLLYAPWLTAQNVGINTTGAQPDTSAMLDISSSDKGLLIPRMDSTSRKNIMRPAEGLTVYDSTYNSFWVYNGMAWAEMAALDAQQLTLINDSLFLSNDASPVALSDYRQSLSLSNDTLRISNGTTPIDLKPYKDNLGNHIATQNIQLNGHMINNDGDANEGIYVDPAGHVGFNHAGATDALLQIGTAPGSVFKLKDDGFQINEYTLPITAGNVNDILMTDGNGNVSWVNPLNQGFGDTLGNHIATQNISSDGHWLINNSQSNGIYLDTLGRMGVKLLPQANLHVFMGETGDTSEFAGFSGADASWIDAGLTWQSFTSTRSGELTDLILPFWGWRYHNYTVSLVEGEGAGAGGTTLYTTTTLVSVPVGVLSEFSFAPPPGQKIVLQAGQKYSIVINFSSRWQWIDGNGYAGGRASNDANKDHTFKLLGKPFNPGFMVTDTTVTFNEYSFPATDGTVGQSLVTDGAGNLNWTNLIGGSPQQLTLMDDTLRLTDGGAPISLKPYLDADDLGNHTATQNLILGNHNIQYDNSAGAGIGLSLETNNNLTLASTSARPAIFKCNDIQPSGVGAYIEVRNAEGTRALLGPNGWGFSGGDTSDVIVANWSLGELQFITQGTQQMYLSDVGNVGIGRSPSTNRLEVEGEASKSTAGNWLANSDLRLKKNIQALDSKEMLEKLTALQGITYEWADDETGTKRPEGLHYGFTAQNIQEQFPSLVSEDNTGYLQTAYGSLDAMTFAAIKALKEKVEGLRERNETLKTQLEEVRAWKADLQPAKSSASDSSEN